MARPQPGSARVTSQVTAQLTMERRLVFAVFAPSGARSGQAFDCNTSLAGSALSHSVMARLMGGASPSAREILPFKGPIEHHQHRLAEALLLPQTMIWNRARYPAAGGPNQVVSA